MPRCDYGSISLGEEVDIFIDLKHFGFSVFDWDGLLENGQNNDAMFMHYMLEFLPRGALI